MKKIVVISLEHHREATLEKLQDLGVIHVQPVEKPLTNNAGIVADKLKNVRDCFIVLDEFGEVSTQKNIDISPEKCVEEVNQLEEKRSQLNESLQQLNQQISELRIWGEFQPEKIIELKNKGIFVKLYRCNIEEIPEIPEGCVLHEFIRENSKVAFAVVGTKDFSINIPEIVLPDVSLLNLVKRSENVLEKIKNIKVKIKNYVSCRESLGKYKLNLQEDFERENAGDQLSKNGNLIYLQGFAPETDLEKIHEAVNQNGWGILENDVDIDDPDVPVKLKIPKLFKTAKVILDFVGIVPGYNETDVSVCFLFFLTIFFGMIVGDAGYGILFLIIALILKSKKKEPKAKLPLNLFLIMSIFTIFWGWLNGNFFAIPKTFLPSFMQGSDWVAGNDKHIQQLCFLIAAFHLSLARVWKAILFGKRLKALGHIGWGMIIWANYFTAIELIVENGTFPQFAYYLYGLGVVFVLGFGVNWKDLGEVMNLPFNFINSFVDVLSYIRLFAVGLASYYIAESFNNMGKMVYDISPWLIPAVILVLLFGHLLNIALAFMGVLVHGIRLNTLEFSNHMTLTWSGKIYNPLKRKEKTI